MRWDHLFADLEAQFDEMAEAQMLAEVAERQRIEFGGVGLVARLAGSIGGAVRLTTTAGMSVTGTLRSLGPDWVLVDEAPGRQSLVSLAAVTVIDGLTSVSGQPLRPMAAKLTMRSALRGITRDRAPVAVVVPGSMGGRDQPTATELTGTIDRVGADFLELAVHAAWEPRRSGSVRRIAVIPLAAIVFVRAQPIG